MNIERELATETSIEQFAELHNLTMRITERPAHQRETLCRYSARFKNVEIMGDGVLIGASGEGETEYEAINDYAKEISGKEIAIGAYTKERRNVFVPHLV